MSKLMTSGLIALSMIVGLESCFIGRKARQRRRAAAAAADVQTASGNGTGNTPAAPRSSTDTTAMLVRVDTASTKASAALAETALARLADFPAWTTFSGKAKMHFRGNGQDQDFNAAFRIEKDKRIWVSITGSFLGITMEAARALITPDSIQAIERIHHDAYVLPFSESDKLLPLSVSFADLQDLILGRAFSSGLAAGSRNPYAEQSAEGTLLVLSNRNFTQRMQLSAEGRLLSQEVQPESAATPGIQLVYRDYENVQDRPFSKGRTIRTAGKNGPIELEMDFSNAAFNEQLDFTFSIPSKYNRKQPGR